MLQKTVESGINSFKLHQRNSGYFLDLFKTEHNSIFLIFSTKLIDKW